MDQVTDQTLIRDLSSIHANFLNPYVCEKDLKDITRCVCISSPTPAELSKINHFCDMVEFFRLAKYNHPLHTIKRILQACEGMGLGKLDEKIHQIIKNPEDFRD